MARGAQGLACLQRGAGRAVPGSAAGLVPGAGMLSGLTLRSADPVAADSKKLSQQHRLVSGIYSSAFTTADLQQWHQVIFKHSTTRCHAAAVGLQRDTRTTHVTTYYYCY